MIFPAFCNRENVIPEAGGNSGILQIDLGIQAAQQFLLVRNLQELERCDVGIHDFDHPGRLGQELRMLVKVFPEIGYSALSQFLQSCAQL